MGEARPDSGGLTLTTGKLELEVKEADDKKPTVENPDKKPTVVPKSNAGLLTLTTEGNRVHVKFKLRDEEYDGVAERVAYDAETSLLILESAKTDGVRLLKYRGKDIVEELTCQKVVLDGQKQTLSVVGAGSIRR